MYFNCCCSCSFEREIINIGQSSHKMYSNNILNSQKSDNLLKAPRMLVGLSSPGNSICHI